ncbi:MAG: PepSY domain-containing protein [Gallionella sp.]|jgi:uncharacterized membrane protein YkoI
MKQATYVAAFLVLSAAVFGTAYAAKATENDALTINTAKISLIQAVTSAEQHVGGKASSADYEQHKGKWVFDIEVVKDKSVMDVKVDATSGQVIVATEDKADRDDKNDRTD